MKPSASTPQRQPRPVSDRPLGDMLQRLAMIAPNDVYALTALVRDVLREADRRHQRFLPHDKRP